MPVHDDIVAINQYGSAPANPDDFLRSVLTGLEAQGFTSAYSPPGTMRPPREAFNVQWQQLTRLAVYLRNRGAGMEWDRRIVYEEDAIVEHANVLYVALNSNSDSEPSSTSTDWRVLQHGAFIPAGTIPLNRMVDGTEGHVLKYDSNGVLAAAEDAGLTPQQQARLNAVSRIYWSTDEPSGGVEGDAWMVLLPDLRHATAGTRISLSGYSNVGLNGIAVANNTIYVLDDTNNEVARFALDGTFQDAITLGGLSSGNRLHGLSVAGSTLYVLDVASNLIREFNLSGTQTDTISAVVSNGRGISVAGGIVYVIDNGADRVRQFDFDGNEGTSVQLPSTTWLGLAVSGNIIYALQDAGTTQAIRQFNFSGNEGTAFTLPSGVYTGLSILGNTLYALDDTSTNESVLPVTADRFQITDIARRTGGAWVKNALGIN